MENPPPLSVDQVRKVATLARLRPSDADVERYRSQLAAILQHVAQLSDVDVTNVEPLVCPGVAAMPMNRLDADEVVKGGGLDMLRRNAPVMEGRLLAVPKVVDADAGGA